VLRTASLIAAIAGIAAFQPMPEAVGHEADPGDGGALAAAPRAFIDASIHEPGPQETGRVSAIRFGDKIGCALYLENCGGFQYAEIEITWDETRASWHTILSGPDIPDETIAINGRDAVSLAAEKNVFERGGGGQVDVRTEAWPGRMRVTCIGVPPGPGGADSGLLWFAAFRTKPGFARLDSLTVGFRATLYDKGGERVDLAPVVFTAYPLERSVTLLSPDGGDSYIPGEERRISWISHNLERVRLDWSADGGATWTEISRSADASRGELAWNTPPVESDACLVRISDALDAAITDESERTFSIRASTSIHIALPDTSRDPYLSIDYIVHDSLGRPVSLEAEYAAGDGGWKACRTKADLSGLLPPRYRGTIAWLVQGSLDGYRGTVTLRVTASAGESTFSDAESTYVDMNRPHGVSVSVPGDTVSGVVSIAYTVTDREGDPVELGVLYSLDAGATWSEAAVAGAPVTATADSYEGTLLWLSREDVPGERREGVLVKVVASDGYNAVESLAGPVTVDNSPAVHGGMADSGNAVGIPVLALHNVAVSTEDRAPYSVTPTMLERLLVELDEEGFGFVSTEKYLSYIIDGEPIPERSVHLTFDDGCIGMYSHVFPLVRSMSVPICIGLITSCVNSKYFLADYHIREMHDSGLVEFQSHSHNLHNNIGNRPAIQRTIHESAIQYRARLLRDFWKSIDIIEGITGVPPRCLYLPYGIGDETIESHAREAGFDAVFYIDSERKNTYGTDPSHLDRIMVTRTNIKFIPRLLSHDVFGRFTSTLEKAASPAVIDDYGAVGGVSVSRIPGGIIMSSPAIGPDGCVYIGSWDGRVYAFDPGGTLRWTFRTGGGIVSSPAVDGDGVVYAGSSDRHVYAINPDGLLKWKCETWGEIVSSPSVAPDGTVHVGSTDGGVIAIAPDGTRRWEYRSGDMLVGSPAVGPDGRVYIGSWDNTLSAYSADGDLMWRYAADDGIESSPAIGADGTVYAGSMDSHLYAVSPDGTLRWRYRTGGWIDSSPVVGEDGMIYIGSWDGFLHAVRPDGRIRWKYRAGARIHSTPAIGADGTVYVGSMDGRLHAVDAFGGVKWTFQAGAGIDSSPNISDDGIVYVASTDGWLYGIDSGTGAGLAAGPWPRFMKDTGGTGVVSGPPVAGKRAAEQAPETGTPLEYRLGVPHPNPFNAVTVIEYTLPRDTHARLSIHNAAGQRYRVLVDARQVAGSHTVSWHAGDAPSGLYFCRLESPAFTATRKLLLVK